MARLSRARTAAGGVWWLAILLCLFLAGCETSHLDLDALIKMGRSMKAFDHKGLVIRYQEAGEGRPVILIHGYGASSYTWRNLVGPLAEKYQVFALDLKGFGFSDKPEDDRYSIADQAEIVAAFIEEKGLTGVTLVGNSMGGAVAMMTWMDLNHGPDGPVERLVLIDSAAYKQKLPSFIWAASIPWLNRLSGWLLSPRFTAELVLKQCYYEDDKLTEAQVMVYAAYLELPGSRYALMKTAQQIVPPNTEELTGQLGRISVPVLVIWGEEDEVIAPHLGHRLANDILGARLVIIPKCGHLPQEERPQKVLELIKNFLKEQD